MNDMEMIGPGMLVMLPAVASVIVHLALAAAVWADTRKLIQGGRQLEFLGPTLWTLAVAVGGVVAAGFYWIIHHSTIRPDRS